MSTTAVNSDRSVQLNIHCILKINHNFIGWQRKKRYLLILFLEFIHTGHGRHRAGYSRRTIKSQEGLVFGTYLVKAQKIRLVRQTFQLLIGEFKNYTIF